MFFTRDGGGGIIFSCRANAAHPAPSLVNRNTKSTLRPTPDRMNPPWGALSIAFYKGWWGWEHISLPCRCGLPRAIRCKSPYNVNVAPHTGQNEFAPGRTLYCFLQGMARGWAHIVCRARAAVRLAHAARLARIVKPARAARPARTARPAIPARTAIPARPARAARAATAAGAARAARTARAD